LYGSQPYELAKLFYVSELYTWCGPKQQYGQYLTTSIIKQNKAAFTTELDASATTTLPF